MKQTNLEIEVVVNWATKNSFSFEHDGAVMRFNNTEIDFPIYRGHPVERLYKGEVITWAPGSETDPSLVATVEIPALRDFFDHVSHMEPLIDRSLTVEEADALYRLLRDLKVKFGTLGSARNSQVAGMHRSISDRAKRTLGLTPALFGQIDGVNYASIGPSIALQRAERHLQLVEETHGRTLLWRVDRDMLTFILEHRPESLTDGLEGKYRKAIQTLSERIDAIAGYEYEKQDQERIPFPDEVLKRGETRMGICDSWNAGGGGYGRISWVEDGRTVRCKAGQAMLFFPAGRFVQERRLYPQERIRIRVMSRQELADQHYAGNLDGGDPNELRTEITIVGAEQYFKINLEIQKLVNAVRLDQKQEETLISLMEHADQLHATMTQQRLKALKVKGWHDGLQRAGTAKLGVTRAIRRTLNLTPEAPYEKIWGRVKLYRGRKSNQLDYGKRMELTHLRSLAQIKLVTQDLPYREQIGLDQIIELTDTWLAPFE